MVKKNQRASESLSISDQTTLSDKQSVRTTFRLRKATFQKLDWLAKSHSISRKEVIDQAISEFAYMLVTDSPKISQGLVDVVESFKNIEDFYKEYLDEKNEFIRKTQVLSRKTLNDLERFAQALECSRDRLIEVAIVELVRKIVSENDYTKIEMVSPGSGISGDDCFHEFYTGMMRIENSIPWIIEGIEDSLINQKRKEEYKENIKIISNKIKELDKAMSNFISKLKRNISRISAQEIESLMGKKIGVLSVNNKTCQNR